MQKNGDEIEVKHGQENCTALTNKKLKIGSDETHLWKILSNLYQLTETRVDRTNLLRLESQRNNITVRTKTLNNGSSSDGKAQ